MKKINKKGFTIVELSIVIAVIAILSAVLIPTFTGIVKKSKDSAAIQEARNAYTQYTMACTEAEEDAESTVIYKADNGKFVVINNGQVHETAFNDMDAAAEKLGYVDDEATTNVDESDYVATPIDGTNFSTLSAPARNN